MSREKYCCARPEVEGRIRKMEKLIAKIIFAGNNLESRIKKLEDEHGISIGVVDEENRTRISPRPVR